MPTKTITLIHTHTNTHTHIGCSASPSRTQRCDGACPNWVWKDTIVLSAHHSRPRHTGGFVCGSRIDKTRFSVCKDEPAAASHFTSAAPALLSVPGVPTILPCHCNKPHLNTAIPYHCCSGTTLEQSGRHVRPHRRTHLRTVHLLATAFDLMLLLHNNSMQAPRLSRADGTYALIVAPTRELCLQIHDVAMLLLKKYIWLVSEGAQVLVWVCACESVCELVCACVILISLSLLLKKKRITLACHILQVPGLVIGGENRVHEKARLRKGLSVLVATPGRLMDHLESTACFKIGERG